MEHSPKLIYIVIRFSLVWKALKGTPRVTSYWRSETGEAGQFESVASFLRSKVPKNAMFPSRLVLWVKPHGLLWSNAAISSRFSVPGTVWVPLLQGLVQQVLQSARTWSNCFGRAKRVWTIIYIYNYIYRYIYIYTNLFNIVQDII